MALSLRTIILIRDRRQFTPKREEGHVKTKGRDGSEGTRYVDSHPKAPTAGGGMKITPTPSSRACRGCIAGLTPGFQASALLSCQKVLSILFLSRQFVVICYCSLRKLLSLDLPSSSHFLPYNLPRSKY